MLFRSGLVGDAERPSSLLATRLYGVDVVFGTSCRMYRVSDGKILQQRIAVRDCSPVMAGENIVCSANGGNLVGVQIVAIDGDQSVRKGCQWEDSHTDTDLIASPLYDQGFIYTLNQRGMLVVWQLKGNSAKVVYQEPMNMLHPLFHIGSARLGCLASPTLGGRYIYLMDNQGTTVVIEPGDKFKQVAVNRIENFLSRDIMVNMQETFSACPVFDGSHIYMRGEDVLYCIGER